jgi:hypothetical protein
MASQPTLHPGPSDPQRLVKRWQAARTWARLIREAECLWHVDVRTLHRLAAQELGQLQHEVPPTMRLRVNNWLQRFGVATRLGMAEPLDTEQQGADGCQEQGKKKLLPGRSSSGEKRWTGDPNRSGGI